MGDIFINRKDGKVKAKRKVRYKPALLHENKKCSSYSEELGYATQHLRSAALISLSLIRCVLSVCVSLCAFIIIYKQAPIIH